MSISTLSKASAVIKYQNGRDENWPYIEANMKKAFKVFSTTDAETFEPRTIISVNGLLFNVRTKDFEEQKKLVSGYSGLKNLKDTIKNFFEKKIVPVETETNGSYSAIAFTVIEKGGIQNVFETVKTRNENVHVFTPDQLELVGDVYDSGVYFCTINSSGYAFYFYTNDRKTLKGFL